MFSVLAVTGAGAGQAAQIGLQPDDEFAEEGRPAVADRVNVWREKRLELYRRRLRAEEIAAPDRRSDVITAYEDELGVPAGNYRIDLENGRTVVVNVTRPTASERVADQLRRVNALCEQIQDNLDHLQVPFYRSPPQVFRDLVFAVDKARALQRQAAAADSPEDVSDDFQAFVKAWDGVAVRLRQSPVANPQALEQIGNVRRLTDAIARTLARPSDSGFDRIRAGELASMLADVMQRASESLRRDGSDLTLAVRAERARQESAELRDAISRRDVLPAVVRAYQQWVQAWTRLAAYAEQLPESAEALDEARRVRIRSLDQQLQAELVVSPGADGLPATVSLTSDLVATAGFLARELREEAAESDSVLLADEFALAARDFHRSFIEGQSRAIQQDSDRLQRQWRTLRSALNDLTYANARDSLQAAEMVEALLAVLRDRGAL